MEAMSNAEREALVREVFSGELAGHNLITGGSSWRQFPVIRNREWVAGKHVLLGDAHMSAHFSIGSGTRIAMEDSIALAEAITDTTMSVPERLAKFSAARGAEKARLIGASERSYLWYEQIAEWIPRYTPHQFVYAFMTRTGRVDNDRLAQQFPALFAELRQHAVI
jgi:2-polyprenyl-6-methoxyphenol hydroxylase-like FAD-dependent oxidoreductase